MKRREFVGQAALLAGALPFAPGLLTRAGSAATGYHALTRSEATFTEAMVNALCPADRLTPNGTDCGLGVFIDRKLAGEFGAERSTAGSRTKRELFTDGVTAINGMSRRRFGVSFEQLDAREAGALFGEAVSGSLSAWHTEVVQPLLVQASFSGPVYGTYDNNVFSKLFG